MKRKINLAKKSAFHTDNIALTAKVCSIFPYFSPTTQLRSGDFSMLNNMLKGKNA